MKALSVADSRRARGLGHAFDQIEALLPRIALVPDAAIRSEHQQLRRASLVLLSGRGEEEAQRCERIVQASGVEWTIVRASWFAQNFSESYLDPILAGEVALPAGNIGEPFVDADDIADVVVAALTEDRHVGQLYEVTGPRLWTFAEAIAEIARATGRKIGYLQVPLDVYAAEARKAQVPGEVVDLLAYLFREVLDGRNASVTNGVSRALNRPPRDFSDYVRSTAWTGVWSPRGD